MQIVFSSIFLMLCLFYFYKIVFMIFEVDLVKKQAMRNELLFTLVYSVPLLYFLEEMFIKTAEINSFFDI